MVGGTIVTVCRVKIPIIYVIQIGNNTDPSTPNEKPRFPISILRNKNNPNI